MDQPEFLTFEDVLAIHGEQLELYGGAEGIIDEGVIRSAIAEPRQTMFGQYLHDDITKMAAAYLFHLAMQQGFRDGNKRTALVATVEFLGRNGYRLSCSNEAIYDVTMRVANHLMDKDGIAGWVLDHLEPI